MRRFKVGATGEGQRADVYLASKYPEFTRSSLEVLFNKELVKLKSQPVKPGQKLKAGAVLTVDDQLLNIRPEVIDIPIIYEDNNVIVLNKPAGLLTHSKGVLNNEATVASFIASKLDKLPSGNRAGIVHRLDRGTSGLIICAKNESVLKFLQKQFSTRKVYKTYLAVVEGIPEPDEAIIEAPIDRNPRRPQTFLVKADGKQAITKYKIIKTIHQNGKTYSLVELRPQTGRTHQLRIHMAYIGHPILGDHIYGHGEGNILLHAQALELTLPGGKRRVFEVQQPKYFQEFINAEK